MAKFSNEYEKWSNPHKFEILPFYMFEKCSDFFYKITY